MLLAITFPYSCSPSNSLGMIEVDDDRIDTASRTDWDEYLIKELGFSDVGVRVFKSGSVAGGVPEQAKSAGDKKEAGEQRAAAL